VGGKKGLNLVLSCLFLLNLLVNKDIVFTTSFQLVFKPLSSFRSSNKASSFSRNKGLVAYINNLVFSNSMVNFSILESCTYWSQIL
jgi:hypothetical protein